MPSRPKTKGGRDKDLSWLVTSDYLEMSAIKEWGLTPKQWRMQPKEDRIKMLAFCRVRSKMESDDNKSMRQRMQDSQKKAQQEQGNTRGRRGWS